MTVAYPAAGTSAGQDLAALAADALTTRQVGGAVRVAEVVAAARLIEFMRGLSR